MSQDMRPEPQIPVGMVWTVSKRGKAPSIRTDGSLTLPIAADLDSPSQHSAGLLIREARAFGVKVPRNFILTAGQVFYRDRKIEEVRLTGSNTTGLMILNDGTCLPSGSYLPGGWKTPVPPKLSLLPSGELALAPEDEGRTHTSVMVVQGEDGKNALALLWDLRGNYDPGRIITRQAFEGLVWDVTRPTVRAVSSLTGAEPRNLSEKAELETHPHAEDEPVGVVFKWSDGQQEQLELFAEPGETRSPLLAVARKYGPPAVRDLMVLYALTWARQASANELIWWWPDEHLELARLTVNKENKAQLCEFFDKMHKTKLEVHYNKGRPLKGPVVAFTATDTVARQVKLHPALYRGVQHEDGTPGNRWWWGPVELLGMPADRKAGRVHTLAVVAGFLWRNSLQNGEVLPARIGADRLAEYLAIRGRLDGGAARDRDGRAAGTLRRTLDAAVECGLIGRWDVARGDLEDLDNAVLSFTPGSGSIEVVRGTRKLQRPALLPATGFELAKWLKESGMTAKAAGELLEVAISTMQRAAAYGGRPLPDKIRRALRHYLWPSSEK